jgi:formylglycine-generating enzyme required for sulfatase activity
MEDVKARLHFARTVEKRSIHDVRALWDEAIASIADEILCPQYKGLKIKPIMGLVPIGQDPDSGLWEFAHIQTGEIPLRDMDGRLMLDEGVGLVLVLIPGGSFKMGARLATKDHTVGMPNVDPYSETFERPVHEVTLPPFLLSKFEMTQGQWLRFMVINPSIYAPGWGHVTLLHPVEHVSWKDCTKTLFRLKLRLPTESEWEYGTRAGTATIWWTGNDSRSLESAANLCDLYWLNHGGSSSMHHEEWDDGHAVHAPVGRYLPNAFGLHDVMGNLWEWCQDRYHPDYRGAPADGSSWELGHSINRVYRGGSWDGDSSRCRSAYRNKTDPTDRAGSLGIRPAASLPWRIHDSNAQDR